ncbi:hypothetical protein AAP_05584 [Ascosphaera apis ARSEF 7405]|uniref:Uncharacterized protein n=1 Tax=Ascosphaera apis ARSEF 7405 TaxID=392613 RepID=A0A167VGM9_9EURO|nr:hypothetical protein AAP_05584 [Ascosphaera apis ARSEF 7405]
MGGGPEALYLPHQSLASSAAAPSSANRIPPMSSVEAMSMSAPYGLLQSHQSPFPSSSGSTFADEQRLSLSQSLSSRQSMSSSTHSPMGMSDSTMSSPQELNHYPGYWSQNTNQYTNFNSGRNSVNMPLASGSVAQSAYNIQPHTASYQSPPPRSSTGTSSTVVSPHQQQQQLQQPPPISQMMITTVPDHETLPALAQQHPAVDSDMQRHTLVKGCGKAAAASEEKSGSTKPSTPGTRSPASIKSLPHSTEQTQTPKRAATHDLSPLHSATEL